MHNNRQKHSESANAVKAEMSTKVIRDWNPDIRINPDPYPDVCRIAPKMCIYYLVGVSRFAKFRTSRLVTV